MTRRRPPSEIRFDLDSFRDKSYLTHGLHPYPAKFVPQIPKLVIAALSSPGDLVVDPFCGSGTSLVEAAVAKRQSIGFDLNPLACLIARAKTHALSSHAITLVQDFRGRLDSAAFQLRFGKASEIEASPVPSFRNRDHWFLPHVSQELAFVRQILLDVRHPGARDFLEVAFSSIIVRVSNQDSDTRWVAVEKTIPVGATLNAVSQRIAKNLSALVDYGCLGPIAPRVEVHDAALPFPLADRSVDLVVTSPPYMNSYDYYLYHKLRFFWLGFDHHRVQANELGSRHRHSDLAEGADTYSSGILTWFHETRRMLKRSGRVCIVVGDSILRGRLVDMGRTFEALGREAGFRLLHEFKYDQRHYSSAFTRGLRGAFKHTHILFFAPKS